MLEYIQLGDTHENKHEIHGQERGKLPLCDLIKGTEFEL